MTRFFRLAGHRRMLLAQDRAPNALKDGGNYRPATR